jgi:DNA replication protein DnaC
MLDYDNTPARRIAEQQLERERAESLRVSRLSKEQLISEFGRKCPHCGQMLEPYQTEQQTVRGLRKVWHWPSKHGCPEEMIALQAHEQRKFITARQQAEIDRRKLIARAGLADLLETYTFDHYTDREEWPAASGVRARVKAYAYSIEAGTLHGKPWLVLHGEYGTGKSHLAAAVIHYMVDLGWRECYFRVWTRYINRLQATMDRKRQADDEFGHETQADILAELTRGAVVAIDDIDKQPASEWTRSKLFDVLNTRYNKIIPTVLTFNTSLADRKIEDYIGRAVLDRIMQHAYDIIEFNGPSYRLTEGV